MIDAMDDSLDFVFHSNVREALKTIESILETTRHPQILDANTDHSYDDKFLVVETCTNTSLAALRTCLGRLGVTDAHWKQWQEWVQIQHKTVTLRLQASDSCRLVKESVVEVSSGTTTTTTHDHSETTNKTVSTQGVNSKSATTTAVTTTTTEVKQKVKKSHWEIGMKHSLVAFAGNSNTGRDTDHHVLIAQREASTVIIKVGGRHEQATNRASAPLPPHRNHPARDLNLTWLVQHINVSVKDDTTLSFECDFSIDRSVAKTPRRNKEIEQSLQFHKQLHQWVNDVKDFFSRSYNDFQQDVGTVNFENGSIFCPIQPLCEKETGIFCDVGILLNAHAKEVDEKLRETADHFLATNSSQLWSVSEATYFIMCAHMVELVNHYEDCVNYIERLLVDQLIKAIGKKVTSQDFTRFMHTHARQLFNEAYAPRPFSYAVRQPGHAPDGTVAIESNDSHEPIDSYVCCIPPTLHPTNLEIPLSAASSAQINGDWYLHGWLLHRFSSQDETPKFSLSARARQFSSFMLVIGNMSAAHQLEPKHAIILQNKDELLIPLLTEVLPSAQDFRDATASLSPEQREFCKAFRAMQLGSSMFGVVIIQLKPQLERLLGLVPGSLTKEIQLTQDLMRLFIEYQIPSDLLSFEGASDASKGERLEAVRGHVSAVLNTISNEKEKTILREEQRAEYRMAEREKNMAEALDWIRGSPEDDDVSICSRGSCYSGKKKNPTPAECREQEIANALNWLRGRELPARGSVGSFGSLEESKEDGDMKRDESAHSLSRYGKDQSTMDKSSVVQDLTMFPKELDKKLEQLDTDSVLHSTKIKAGVGWDLQRQENIMSLFKQNQLSEQDIVSEKNRAFDLLDALSRSGSLPIEAAELHVVACLSHCFEKDLMGTIIRDNINPIAKVERSAILFASTIHHRLVAPTTALMMVSPQHTQRLKSTFPLLFDALAAAPPPDQETAN